MPWHDAAVPARRDVSENAETIRRSFERQVELFSGPDSPFAAPANPSLAWIGPLDPSMIVLDVACGAAHASEPLAPHVRQVVGVDLTPALLQLGAERTRAAGIDNLLLQEGDAEALPFTDASFDVVCCRSSVHHFVNPQRAVDEMVRVTRPGGRVVLLDVVAPDDDCRDTYDDVHRLLDPSHVRALLDWELAGLLPDGGDALAYATRTTARLPVDLIFTEQADRAAVEDALAADLAGRGPRTGFAPEVDESGRTTVAFTTCILHHERLAW